jgi:hypothetical protein
MKYVKKQIITGCYHRCIFFDTDMDGMKCSHPYFYGKGYEGMIITHDNSKNGNIPEKCPLRDGRIKIVTKISLN